MISCQPVEIIEPIQIDNSRFEKISINAKEIEININIIQYFLKKILKIKLKIHQLDLISNWHRENIQLFGNENKLLLI